MGDCDKSKVGALAQKRPAEHSPEEVRVIKKSNNNSTTLAVVDQNQHSYCLRPRTQNPNRQQDSKENIEHEKTQITPVLKDKADESCKVMGSPVPDVDSGSSSFFVPQYAQTIFQNYKKLEHKFLPVAEYMMHQPNLKPSFRRVLVDWLVDIHFQLKMKPETIFLTVNILDRFLSQCQVGKEFLQLVGCSALLIGSKYEEIYAPQLSELVQLCDGLYNKQQIIQMEKKILMKLDYQVTVPSQYHFLLRYLRIAGLLKQKETAHLAFYMTELAMLEYDMLKHKPSLICVAAIYAAMKTMKFKDCFPYNLRKHCDYTYQDIRGCAIELVNLQKKYSIKAECRKLCAVTKKYQKKAMLQVSEIAVSKELEEDLQKGIL